MNKFTSLVSSGILRYVIVGLLSLCADYAVFVVLYYLVNAGTAIAAPAGLIVGLIVSFVLNKIWSFGNMETAKKQLTQQVFLYVILVVLNSIFSYYFIEILKEILLIEPKYSKLLATATITLWNYAIYKKIIFNNLKN